MKAKEFIIEVKKSEAPKPRNFVAKNAKMGGAGQHKDKKKAEKQGDTKHKKQPELSEVSLGDYRKKAAMQKAQAGMSAMFARDPAEREKSTATFNKRERGLNRLKARDEKSRADAQAKQLADLVARLPEIKAEYEAMRAEYKSLGGSDWQYADREQNLTPAERKARDMEGPMNNLWRQIQAAEKAQKSESVEEAEKKGLYYYVNKRKKAGTSRDASHPKAPSAQAWKDAAKTAKKESVEEVYIQELSSDLLAAYKKKAGEQASAADKAGDYEKGNKRFKGIVKATNKQFDNDAKKNK